MSSASITSINSNFSVASAPVVLCMTWSYDGSIFAIGTCTGYIVYSFEGAGGGIDRRGSSRGDQPLKELCRRSISTGVRHISIFGQYSLVMFVGATEESQNIVYIWDDKKFTGTIADAEVPKVTKDSDRGPVNSDRPCDIPLENHRCVVAKLVMDAPVRAIRLHKCCTLVADDNFVHMFDENLRKQGTFSGPCEEYEPENNPNTIDIARNPVVVRSSYECTVVRFICLGPQVGSLWSVRYLLSVRSTKRGLEADAERYREKNLVSRSIIPVHTRGIRTMKLCSDGSLAVTISQNGTAFKLVDIVREEVLRQFSRGTTPNNVPSICISEDSSYFVSLSESGTLHTFFIDGGPSEYSQHLGMVQLPECLKNNHFIKGSVAYAQSHKSVVSYSLLDAEQDYEVTKNDVFSDNVLENLRISNMGRSFIPISARYSCLAIRPEAQAGMAAIFACIGGTCIGAKARCLRVSLNLREGTARRAATHMFPREEL